MVAKSESPVGRWFIPLFIGFQHVSTIQGDKGFLPSTVVIDNLAKDWDHPLAFSKGSKSRAVESVWNEVTILAGLHAIFLMIFL